MIFTALFLLLEVISVELYDNLCMKRVLLNRDSLDFVS